jgi:uncharacterized protein YodC (DUF2158 family)
VYLKSGRPRMTVREINNPYSDVRRVDVVCDWFDHNAGHSFARRFLTSSSAWRWVKNEPKRSFPSRTDQPSLVGSTRKIVVIACLATSERSYFLPPRRPVNGEIFFRASRFRPVRSTSIGVFKAMLAPFTPTRQPEEVGGAFLQRRVYRSGCRGSRRMVARKGRAMRS